MIRKKISPHKFNPNFFLFGNLILITCLTMLVIFIFVWGFGESKKSKFEVNQKPVNTNPRAEIKSVPVELPLQGEDGETIAGYGDLRSFDIALDGQHLATGGSLGAFIWDLNLEEPKPVTWIRGFPGPVNKVQYSPEGKYLLISNGGYHTLRSTPDKLTILWDLEKGVEKADFSENRTMTVTSASFSRDSSKLLLAKEAYKLDLWEVETGKLIHHFRSHFKTISRNYPYFRNIHLTPDSQKVLACCSETLYWNPAMDKIPIDASEYLLMWDLDSSDFTNLPVTKISSIHVPDHFIVSSIFAPNGDLLLLGYESTKVKIWNFEMNELMELKEKVKKSTSKTAPQFKHPSSRRNNTVSLTSVSISPDSKYILTGINKQTVKLWDASDGHLLQEFGNPPNRIFHACFHPDGTKILLGDKFAKQVKIIDIQSGEELLSLHLLEKQTLPDSLLDQFPFDTVGAFNYSQFNIEFPVKQDERILAVSFDQQYVLTVKSFMQEGMYVQKQLTTKDCVMNLYDGTSGKLLHKLEGHNHLVHLAEFCAANAFIVSVANNKTIKVWNTQTGQEINSLTIQQKLENMRDRILTVRFSQVHSTVYVMSDHGNIIKWDVKDDLADYIHLGDQITQALFLNDGRRVLIMDRSRTLKLWDFTSKNLIHIFDDRIRMSGHMCLSKDEKKIAFLESSGTISIWDMPELETMKEER